MKLHVTVDIPVVDHDLCPGDCQFLDEYDQCGLFGHELDFCSETDEAMRCDECKDAELPRLQGDS